MNSKSIAAIVMTTVLATGYGIVQAIGQVPMLLMGYRLVVTIRSE